MLERKSKNCIHQQHKDSGPHLRLSYVEISVAERDSIMLGKTFAIMTSDGQFHALVSVRPVNSLFGCCERREEHLFH